MIKLDGKEVKLNHFPDGTLRIKPDVKPPYFTATIDWRFENNEELAALYFLVKHLRDADDCAINLTMPYIPNARQDRAECNDDIKMMKYFCEFINSLGFSEVRVLDPHSNVAQIINRLTTIDFAREVAKLIVSLGLSEKKDYLVYPDEGAMKRYRKVFSFPHLFGIKVRDWYTGAIQSYIFSGEMPKEPFNALIIDDICSYGGTFLCAAQALKEQGADKVWLYVNHLENSVLDGELIKSGLLDRIYTSDSLFSGEHPLITKLWEAK